MPWHPPRAELELLELLAVGAVEDPPRPILVPAALVEEAVRTGGVLVEDVEGTPVVALTDVTPVLDGLPPSGQDPVPVRATTGFLRPFADGPLRRHRRTPAEVRAELAAGGERPVVAVPVSAALSRVAVARAAERAAAGAALLWLVLVGEGRRGDLAPEPLLRAVRAGAAEVAGAQVAGGRVAGADGAGHGIVVPVAVPALADPAADAALVEAVATAYGAGEVLAVPPGDADRLHRASRRELSRALPPPSTRGVTVFFTGLSGSGKSTLARGLADRLLDDGRRRVSVLDGDGVRRLLSAGLGFGRADRDLNIRRIGFVAAEITRHGGIAVCAPIAPFAAVRAEVRALVEEVGDFVLVHVSTPLAECERRDRKGLYARARQGIIPEFTGISSPYEEPSDADLRIDTSTISVDEGVDRVLALLERGGHLPPDRPDE